MLPWGRSCVPRHRTSHSSILEHGEYRRMTLRKVWMWSPHSGGSRIPPRVQVQTQERIHHHAERHYSGRFLRIEVSFRGAFCYINAYCEPEAPSPDLLRALSETEAEYTERLRSMPLHLCRLRYFGGEEQWSVAFYTYSQERYEPAFFPSGEMFGAPEEGFDLGAVYLR